MTLTVISSSSSGNCYVLQGRRSALVIECGAKPEKVERMCPDLKWSKVAGALVSHEHGDHAAWMQSYMRRGIDVYASQGTLERKGLQGERRARVLRSMQPVHVRDFAVYPFGLVHDAAEPMGFMIQHEECGKLLFITDTSYVPYSFRSHAVDHIMIEANYDDGILDGRVGTGEMLISRAVRVRNTHMSMHDTCEALRANQTGNLKTVTLIHLSGDNGDAERFRKLAESAVIFAKVHVASPGMMIELNKDEFAI